MRKIIVLAITITVSFISCSDDTNDILIKTDDTVEVGSLLSQEEIDDLLFLREEEKLARDVYLFSFEMYGEALFNSISQSEQQHMDQILFLLNVYQLDDPASLERGVFTNQALQDLYDGLTEQASISLIDALTVGATIEDVDIKDIEDFESRIENTNILDVYEMLKCGSRDHLRSYVGQLTLKDASYTPQFISYEEYTEIITSDFEYCGI